MPRQLRIEYSGAIYHLMNRGDYRETIFKDDHDRQRFLTTLGEACGKTGWQVRAAGKSGGGDEWFLSTYTARFNRRHWLFGHLLSERFKLQIRATATTARAARDKTAARSSMWKRH